MSKINMAQVYIIAHALYSSGHKDLSTIKLDDWLGLHFLQEPKNELKEAVARELKEINEREEKEHGE